MSSEAVEPELVKLPLSMRRFIIYAGVVLLAFLLGFVPVWLKAWASASSLIAAEHQLTLVTMQHNLASAAIDARRGDYESARGTIHLLIAEFSL